LWTVCKASNIIVDSTVKELRDLPYTITYVIRKRIQIDNLSELPKDKQPPEMMIWDGKSDDIDKWFDKVFDVKSHNTRDYVIVNTDEVEG
jgi:hypothetical protein